MDFTKAYDRATFLGFLRNNFLPEDFQEETKTVIFNGSLNYVSEVTRLGASRLLNTSVYEIKHTGKQDPRVSLSREAFQILRQQSQRRALVLFVPADDSSNYRFSLITMSFTDDERGRVHADISNPRRYSYLLGENLVGRGVRTPQQFLERSGRVTNFEDLQKRFSVDVLTDAFYNQLSDWYAWAIRTVEFPNDIDDPDDNMRFNKEAMIRLITRLIFVWFIKQKGLVPDEFFDVEYIKQHLIPEIDVDNDSALSRKSHYYKGILQNLFFAMLNSPITAEGGDNTIIRRFRKGRGDYNQNKLMRYEGLFKDADLFVKLANQKVPFLNGGLFECLDDKDGGMYVDAFTDRAEIEQQLIVPDFLFFGNSVGRGLDLTDFYGEDKPAKRNVDVPGLVELLSQYNFTIEENTPIDQDVSLDPELLGKAFENLLASFNPETQSQARKNTGSYYTPREIVNYMVDESLIAYLKQEVGEELEPEYRRLLSYTEQETNLSQEQKNKIMQALYNCKILDPACGSGAFPMGCLQQMVHVLTEIDPQNEAWKEILLKNALQEIDAAETKEDKAEREEALADVENSFNENSVYPDYARKLYLIEHCIYGVDIQCIAIQISKLRFFISLVVDEKTTDDPLDNFGVRPLPNLEAKFVAANTLIGLNKHNGTIKSVWSYEIEKQLKLANHKIFNARSRKTKLRWKECIATLRKELADDMVSTGFLPEEDATMLASWDMFDQNASSKFFDPEWMFGVDKGFDIIIGNPPYVDVKALPNGDVRQYFSIYKTTENRINLYSIFIEKGYDMLSPHGVLTYINPNSVLVNDSYKKLRSLIIDDVKLIIKLPDKVFNLSVETIILQLQKNNTCKEVCGFVYHSNDSVDMSRVQFSKYNISNWKQDGNLIFNIFADTRVVAILRKIEKGNSPMGNFVETSLGITPYDKAKGHSKELIKNREFHSTIKLDDAYVPLTSGKNIHPYYVEDDAKEYLKYGEWLGAPREERFFTSEKIIVRQIVDGKLNIIAGYSNKSHYFTQIGFSILPKQGSNISCKFLVALLNSKLICFYHKNKFLDPEKVVFQKILIANFKRIPLVVPANQTIFSNLVDKILEAKAHDIGADITKEEQEIDRLAYHLYGLTYDEVLIVDSETPITREEYERS